VQVNPHLLRRRALLVVLLGGEKVGAGKEIFVKSQTSAWHVAGAQPVFILSFS